MTHHGERCARLRVQIYDQYALKSQHGQAISQHHGGCRLTDATAPVGNSYKSCHYLVPELKLGVRATIGDAAPRVFMHFEILLPNGMVVRLIDRVSSAASNGQSMAVPIYGEHVAGGT